MPTYVTASEGTNMLIEIQFLNVAENEDYKRRVVHVVDRMVDGLLLKPGEVDKGRLKARAREISKDEIHRRLHAHHAGD
jgi:hypothetical protein